MGFVRTMQMNQDKMCGMCKMCGVFLGEKLNVLVRLCGIDG